MAGKEELKLSNNREEILEEAGTKRGQFTFEKLMFH